MKYRTKVRIWLIVFLFCTVFWYFAVKGVMCQINHSFSSPSSEIAVSDNSAAVFNLSVKEVQLIIGAEPDGKLGRETQRKWDAYINNQHGQEAHRKATILGIE